MVILGQSMALGVIGLRQGTLVVERGSLFSPLYGQSVDLQFDTRFDTRRDYIYIGNDLLSFYDGYVR